MNQKKKRRVIIVIIAILVVLAIGTAFSFSIFGRVMNNEKAGYLFIDKDDNIDSVRAKIEEVGNPSKMTGFDILTKYTDYDKNIRIGRYKVASDISMLTLFRNLRNGQQTPVNLVVPNSRTIEEACEKIGKNLMLDSKDIKSILSDSTKIKQMGFTEDDKKATIEFNGEEIIIKKGEIKMKKLDVKNYKTNSIIFVIDEDGIQEETLNIDFDGIDFESNEELEQYIKETIVERINCSIEELDVDSLNASINSIWVAQNYRIK